jgi:ubiquinone/menaquinone biosynthesis C-methylase UbiE
MMTQETVGDRYVLATGEVGAGRLELLDAVYGSITARVLGEQGLTDGWHVAELGCGTGTTACWLAGQVGPGGSVTALDAGGDQLAIGRERAAHLGLRNVTFLEGSAYEPELPEGSFDLAFCRFLLCHLQRPAEALARMVSLLRPGGVLVVQEPILDTIFADPPSPAYDRFVELAGLVGDALGVDYSLGRRLAGLTRDAGLGQVAFAVDQPCYSQGEQKRFWEYTFKEAVPRAADAVGVDRDELDRLIDAMAEIGADDTTLVAQACIASGSGRAPA